MTERIATQTRVLTFDIQARAEGDAGIPVVISSDAVVEVADGPEMLVHSPDAVDLQRAPLPIIASHGRGQVNVGLVDGLTFANGQMRGIARFGSRPEAAGYRDDVLGGVIRSVSVGYARMKAKVRSDGVLVTTRWMPTHVAMVAEPADIIAGFYRTNQTTPAFELEVDASNNEGARDLGANQPAAPAANEGVIAMSDVTVPAGQNAETHVVADGTQTERLRVKTIYDLARNHGVDDKNRDSWIERGLSPDACASEVLKVMAGRPAQASRANLDLSNKDTQRFSLMKAVVAARDKDWSKAGFEAECSREIATRLGTVPDPNKFYVPLDVQARAIKPQNAQRDMTVASASGGGYLVDTQNQGFIELLRNRSVVMNMGATRLSGLVGNVTVPKQTAGATAYWLASESTAITEGNQTLGQLSLSPKTVGAYVEISRLLALQSSPDAEGMVMSDVAKQVALAVDSAGLAGAGSAGEPQGIIGTSGVGTFTGTTLDLAALLNAQADVAAANALTAGCGYVFTPAVAALLMARQRFSSTNTPLWEGNMLDGQIVGYRAMSSNQVPSAKGIFGDFSQVVVAEWGVLQVEVNPYANFAAGIIGVRAIYTVDIGVRIPAAFSTTSSIT